MATIVTSTIVPYNEDFNNVASVLRDLGAKFYVRPVENAESHRQIQFSTITIDAQAFVDALIIAHQSETSPVTEPQLEPEIVQVQEEPAQSEIQIVESEVAEEITYYTISDLQPLAIAQMRELAQAQEIEIPANIKRKPQFTKFLAGKLKF